jgi:hypothetical protein
MFKFKLLNSTAILAYDPGKAGWKIGADGKVEAKDGNPIWVDVNGNESVMEGNTVARLNSEAKTHREAAEAANAKLAKFGTLDPEIAKKAVDTVSKLDAKKLIDAGEVDKLTEQIKTQFTNEIAERDKKLSDAQQRIENMTRSDVFKSSKFIQERIAVPVEMFESTFRDRVKVNPDGTASIIGFDGNPVYSKKSIGKIAEVDEAFEILVDGYQHKDAILKAKSAAGSGSNGNGGARGGGAVITRAEFEKLPPHEQKLKSQEAAAGKAQIVD